MDDPKLTRFSLIVRLRDGSDGQAWSEFVDIYTPVVYGFARRFGLQDADAADVTQDVFRTVAGSIGRFECDRRKGSFRAWLIAVTRSRLSDHFKANRGEVPGSGDTAVLRQIEEQPCQDEDAEAWEREYCRSVFQWAARQIRGDFRENTWKAFWLTSVEGKAVRQVAESLGMTEGAVYIAKCRVVARLKEKTRELDE